jgi:hypothetical protein
MLVAFCFVLLQHSAPVAAQGLTLASIPDQPSLELSGPASASAPAIEYNTYNFTHLELDNSDNLPGYGGHHQTHIGGITAGAGLVALIVGLIGMSAAYGSNDISGPPPPMSPNEQQSYNTYRGVAIAGGIALTVGIIVAIADGEAHDTNQGYSSSSSWGGNTFLFFGHHGSGYHSPHEHWHGYGHEHHGSHTSGHPRGSGHSGSRGGKAHTPTQVHGRR